MSHESEIHTLGEAMNAYGYLTWLWVLILSICGGIANFLRKIKANDARPFNIVELFGEIFISGFTGIITFLLCDSAGFNPITTACLVAISGHMGSRGIFMLERVFAERLGLKADDVPPVGPGN